MRALPSERACDAAISLLALWTVAAHAVVFAGGNGYHLVAGCAAATAVGVAGWIALRRHEGVASAAAGETPSLEGDPAGGSRWPAVARIVGALAALGALIVYARTGDVVRLWWAIVILLSLAATTVAWRSPPAAVPRWRGRRGETALWAIALAAALFTLFCHRPDPDDALYVNLAVAVADHPERQLLAWDTMHGIPGLPLINPVYRLHSFELLNGALSLLTGIPAIAGLHLLSATLAALLATLCLARLCRLLMPRHWIWGVLVCVLLLIALGTPHRSYGNYAFVRLFQGKAIFATAVLPAIWAYALRFVLRPGLGRWLLLCAAQIAAVGLTATAVWAAPYAAGLGLVSGARADRQGLRRVATGMLASGYLVAIGLAMRGRVVAEHTGPSEPLAAGFHLGRSLARVLGGGPFELLALAAVLLAWAVTRRGVARRFSIVVPLGVFALLCNPYLEGLVIANVTGAAATHWRGLWLLPVPLLVALVLCAPLRLAAGGRARHLGGLLVGGALAALVLYVPERPTYRDPRGELLLRPGVPSLKVPPEAYAWARKLNRSVAPGESVIAPAAVSTWIPTMHGHAHAVQVRRLYLLQHRSWGHLGPKDVALRSRLVDMVTADKWARNPRTRAAGLEELVTGLGRYGVRAVCLTRNRAAAHLAGALERQGFRQAESGESYEIWVRAPAPGVP